MKESLVAISLDDRFCHGKWELTKLIVCFMYMQLDNAVSVLVKFNLPDYLQNCYCYSFYSGHLPDLWRLQKEIDAEVPLTVAVNMWYVYKVNPLYSVTTSNTVSIVCIIRHCVIVTISYKD